MINFFAGFTEQFHFLRPLWLLSFIPLFLLLMWAWRQHKNSQSWLRVIDAKLQPFVLTHANEQLKKPPKWLPFLALIICVVALAGPVWQQLPQTVYKPQSALVIVLDLSRSMDAADIKPARLTRAKLKIIDLLKARTEGQTALIVYAAQAFTVSPLTDDNDTIVALLKSLSTDIMPAQGSRMDLALAKAQDLMQQAGIQNGHILVVTDGVTLKEFNAIKQLKITRHNISVLAVGTEQGAPITLAQGGYLSDANGKIVIAKMNRHDLLSLAQATQGVFATLRNDDADINAILDLMSLNRLDNKSAQSDKTYDVWYEQGSWLLLLAIPMILMVFRKGFLVLLVVLVLPLSRPAEALDWQQWFKNSDQKAAEQFKAEKFDAAGAQFKQPDWRAAAQFKNKQFEEALQHYSETNDLYNKGNALAKIERYDEALKAWDKALKEDPNQKDVAFNKKQLEAFLKQQKQDQQKQDQQKQDQQKQDQQKQDQQKQDQQKQDQQKQDQQKQDQQKQDQQKQDQQKQDQQKQDQQKQDQQKQDQQKQDQKKKPSDEKQSDKGKKKEQSEQEKQDAKKQEKIKKAQADEQKEKQKTKQQIAAEEALKEQMHDPLDEKTKQWLRRIPDDPGGLMRNKFRYQYKQLNRQAHEQNPW